MCAHIAQLVERSIHIRKVSGSSPDMRTKYMFTIIYFIKRLLFDIFKGIYFAGLDFDDNLKLRYTLFFRIVIWTVIFSFVAVLLSIFVFLLRSYIQNSNLENIFI